RLHPHQQRSAPPRRSGTALAALRRGGRSLSQALSGPVLRGLRAVLPARGPSRWTLSGARHRAAARRGGELVLPALRYTEELRQLIASGRLRIQPSSRRNEVLALIEGGLHDFSISRSQARAHGWGIPVPGDPEQVIYVWWDALGNYVTSLGYGTDHPDFARWWEGSGQPIHLVGKGVIRFNAVYWPAMLLSAGLKLPTDILVHDYLTIDGSKISKSGTVGA